MIPLSFFVVYIFIVFVFVIGRSNGALIQQNIPGNIGTINSTSELYRKYFSSMSSSSPSTRFFSRYLRRLMGSNCLYIERGEVTPYYDCMGCVVEEAVACVDDMRFNRSGTVRAGCSFDRLGERVDSTCCPVVVGTEVNYIGSSYPTALSCLENVGCKDTVIYDDVLAECTRACNYNDPRSSQSICFAGASAAFRGSFVYLIGYIIFTIMSVSVLL